MAYWCYCTNCKQWCVSASPLKYLISDNCPYCDHKLTGNREKESGKNDDENSLSSSK